MLSVSEGLFVERHHISTFFGVQNSDAFPSEEFEPANSPNNSHALYSLDVIMLC